MDMISSSADRQSILALFLLLALATSYALAHEGATGVVKERMGLMKGQAKRLKLIGEMAKSKKKFDAVKLIEAIRNNPRDTFVSMMLVRSRNGWASVATAARVRTKHFRARANPVGLNFQNRGGTINPYQARQLIAMIDKYWREDN
jgi:cytochrome c556